jgi:hypothetical protein
MRFFFSNFLKKDRTIAKEQPVVIGNTIKSHSFKWRGESVKDPWRQVKSCREAKVCELSYAKDNLTKNNF